MNSKPYCMEAAPVLKKVINAAFLLSLVSFFPGIVQAEVPEWLRSLAKQPAKTYADDVNAVVLLDDNVTTVKENGDIVHHNRRALRILRPETRPGTRSWKWAITATPRSIISAGGASPAKARSTKQIF